MFILEFAAQSTAPSPQILPRPGVAGRPSREFCVHTIDANLEVGRRAASDSSRFLILNESRCGKSNDIAGDSCQVLEIILMHIAILADFAILAIRIVYRGKL